MRASWIPSGTTSGLRIGGILLAIAGAYQLTPRKDVCLRRCRSSPRYLGRYAGLLRGGIAPGVDCLECCWSLMLVLLLLGMMSLAWMAIIGGIILAEKIVPRGERVARLVGLALAGLAIILLVAPHPLPALG